MTNFDHFLSDPQLVPFTEAAVAAERIFHIDLSQCVIACRRSMEFAVKWMYSVDGGLVMPYDDRLVSLTDAEDFRDIVGEDLWHRLKYIRQTGNATAHTGKKITPEQAELCLENLYHFIDFIAYCYGTQYTAKSYDKSLLEKLEQPVIVDAAKLRDPPSELVFHEMWPGNLMPLPSTGRSADAVSGSGRLVDLSALMAQQLALDRELLEQRGQQLVSALTPGITVPADASLLGKAVGNLLSNASRYSPEGAEIRVWCGRLEGRPALSVENTGARISGDALPHLFEAFYREEGSRNRSTGGSGLGLYLVKMILDRHGAVCTIENTEEGVKATVRF